MSELGLALVAVLTVRLVWSLYEAVDEIRDDDLANSVIDDPAIAAGLAVGFALALVWVVVNGV